MTAACRCGSGNREGSRVYKRLGLLAAAYYDTLTVQPFAYLGDTRPSPPCIHS